MGAVSGDRLPETHALVFTIHKYFAPMAALRTSGVEGQRAAAMMLRSLERMPPDKLLYTLGESIEWRTDLFSFLRTTANGE